MGIPVDKKGNELSSLFLDSLFLNRDRSMFVKINLLSWDEEKIKEIQGRIISGNFSTQSNSPIRRTLSLEFFLDRNIYSLSAAADEISINKKIQAYIGLKNNVYDRKEALDDDIIWFNLGIFLISSVSFSHGIDSNIISMQCQDKMSMLDGTLGGELGADTSFTYGDTKENIPYFYVIKDLMTKFGAENPQKIIINDLPIYITNIQQITSSVPDLYYNIETRRTFNDSGIPLESEEGFFSPPILKLQEEEEVNVYLPFASQVEGAFSFKSNSTVVQVLNKVKEDLFGSYDFYYDENGFFKFEPIKMIFREYSTQLQYLQEISNDSYIPSYESFDYSYDFSDKGIVSSYSNNPDWRGIKNDFYVYGADNLLFHLVIDSKPVVPSFFYEKFSDGSWGDVLVKYDQPWQQFLIDQSEYLLYKNPGATISPYYEELKAFFEYTSEKDDQLMGIYKKIDSTTGVWRSDNTGIEQKDFKITDSKLRKGFSSKWKYFFDIIDEGAPAYNGFSVNAIGRRIKALNNPNIKCLYPTLVPEE